jgi:hydrogenase/urease accessory protein HupE
VHKIFLLLVATITQPALAHQGDHHGNVVASLWHLLTQPDHLAFAAIITIIVSSVFLSRRRIQKAIRSQHHDSR